MSKKRSIFSPRYFFYCWLICLFIFILTIFYVVGIRKELFNEAPIAFAIILLALFVIGVLSFIGGIFRLIFGIKVIKNNITAIWIVLLIICASSLSIYLDNKKKERLNFNIPVENITEITPTNTPTVEVNRISSPNSSMRTNENDKWGVAKQVSEHTWTMKIGFDDRMASPKEIFDALNVYRLREGSTFLAWDDNLARYAQSRADYFIQMGGMDEHKGFIEYVNNIDNLKKLNFYHVGENSSYGYQLLGVHLIEWIYAGDEPHDSNQLDRSWTHVGIGVNGTATDLIFGE